MTVLDDAEMGLIILGFVSVLQVKDDDKLLKRPPSLGRTCSRDWTAHRRSVRRAAPRVCLHLLWSAQPAHTPLRHFGAEVIKVEPPNTGDPLRVWRELDVDGTSPWFRSLGRNKKSVTIDLRKEEGRR